MNFSLCVNMLGFCSDSRVFKLLLSSRRAVMSCEAKKKQHARAYSGLHNHYSV